MENWFFQHMETINTTKWQWENHIEEVLWHSKEGCEALLFTNPELSDFIQDSSRLSETKILPSDSKATCDMNSGNSNGLQAVEISLGVSKPMKETVQLIKEQLKETNLAREMEEEELRQSVKCIQETFKAELQVEREMKHLLQEQLKEAKLNNQQESMTYKSELRNVQQLIENLQQKLEQEVKQHNLLKKKHEERRQSFQYSQESLTSILQSERKSKQNLQEQLKAAKNSHQEDTMKYMMELKNVQQQAETLRTQLQREVDVRTILYKEHEELKQSIECIQETFIAELQVGRDMKQLHDEQMKELKLTNEQQCIAHQIELENAQRQGEAIKEELEQERKQHLVFKREQEELQLSLQSNQDSLTLLLHTQEASNQLLEEQLTKAKLESTKLQTKLQEVQQQADELKVQLQDEDARWMLYKEEEQQNHSSGGLKEALQVELQLERDINQHLQEQLREATTSHLQEFAAYRAEVEKHQKQTESLKLELGRETKQKELVQAENRELQRSLQYTLEEKRSYQQDCNNYRAELRSVQNLAGNLRCQFQREIQQRTIFQELHEEMKQSLKCTQRSYTFLLQAEREMSQLLQKELNVVRRSNLQDCLKYKMQISDAKEEVTEDPRQEEKKKEVDKEKEMLEKLRDIEPQKFQSEPGFENCLQSSNSEIQWEVQGTNPTEKVEDIFTTWLENQPWSDEASQSEPDRDSEQINILHDKDLPIEEEPQNTCEQKTLTAENKQENMPYDLTEKEIHEVTWTQQVLMGLQTHTVEDDLHPRLPCTLTSSDGETLTRKEKPQVDDGEKNLQAGSSVSALTSEESTFHDNTTEEFQVLSMHNHLLEEILWDYQFCNGDNGPEELEETSTQKTLAEEFHVLTEVTSFSEDVLSGCHSNQEEDRLLDDSSPCQYGLPPEIADEPQHDGWLHEGVASEEDEGERLVQLSSDEAGPQGTRDLESLSYSSDEEGFDFLKTPPENPHHKSALAEKTRRQWCGLSVQ